MSDNFDVVIVGAGHAGAQAAIALRQLGFAGSIALIGNENALPYERPPLTKEFLAGEKPVERLSLRPEKFWIERDITLMLGMRACEIRPEFNEIVLSNDHIVRFGKLIWAAGGSPRMLNCPGAQAVNVHAIRRLSDVERIHEQLPKAERIVVIGGGYIGLEAAAVMAKLGKQVTIVESRERVLARVAGEDLSRFYEAEHSAHGVTIRLSESVDKFETDEHGKASGVILDSGEILPADLIIVGIGIVPETGPLLTKGAAGGDGIDIDEYCRTSLENIYAIGDCACHANPYADGARMRLESVQNANDQAKTAASHIVGDPRPYDAVPWFWSNQYDLKLQTVGLNLGYDSAIVRGDPDQRSFSVVYRRGSKVIALDCVNATKDYVQGRKIIAEGESLNPEQLADPTIPLKEVDRI